MSAEDVATTSADIVAEETAEVPNSAIAATAVSAVSAEAVEDAAEKAAEEEALAQEAPLVKEHPGIEAQAEDPCEADIAVKEPALTSSTASTTADLPTSSASPASAAPASSSTATPGRDLAAFDPPTRPRSVTAPTPGESPSEVVNRQERVSSSELDVAKSDAVLRPVQRIPGLVAHTVGNVIGGATLGAGWALGKADVAVGRHGGLPVPGLGGAKQVSDSGAFKLGFRTMLYANGIWPTVLVEKGPYGNDIGPLPQDPESCRRLLRATPLIISNHVSYLDAVVLPLVLEVPKLMAMSEVANWPLFGKLCQEMEMIWVDRSDPDSRVAAKRAIEEHVEQWNNGDRPLMVFPEGTCSNGQSLKDFKTGVFAPGVEIRPVLIKYTGDWDPANVNFREPLPGVSGGSTSSNCSTDAATPQTASGAPDGKESPNYNDAEWAKQFFGHLFHSCTVLICRPYRPSEAERQNPELFKDNVRELMRQRLEELHEQEDRKRAEKERNQKRMESARALLGNVTKGADQARSNVAEVFGDVSRGLMSAWRERKSKV